LETGFGSEVEMKRGSTWRDAEQESLRVGGKPRFDVPVRKLNVPLPRDP
jgi:hypothetical protein